jgi:hypothetical protein
MAVQVKLYIAPAIGQRLSRDAILNVADDLLQQELVVPPYQVFRGGKGLSEAIRAPTTLTEYVPEWDEPLPRGTEVLYAGDDRRALRSVLTGRDPARRTFIVVFAGLNWEVERVRIKGRVHVSCPASVVLASSPEEISFAFDEETERTGVWQGGRVRRADEVRFRQCLILSGKGGPDIERIKGSAAEGFVRRHLGPAPQVAKCYD